MRQRTKGMLEVAASGLCFGFLGVLGKWAYAQGLTPGPLLSLRFLTAALLLAPVLAVRDLRLLRVGAAPALRAAAFGVFGYAAFSFCYFGALAGLSVSLAVLLLYAFPLWVTLGEVLLLGERLRAPQARALVVLAAGLALLLGGELRVREPGALLLGLASSVLYAAYILASRRWLTGMAALSSSFYVMLGAGGTLAAATLRELPTSGGAWASVLALAVVGTIAPVTLFLAGLQKVRASEASMLSLVEPCTGVAAGALVFGERFGTIQGLGAVVIGLGLALVAMPSVHDENRA